MLAVLRPATIAGAERQEVVSVHEEEATITGFMHEGGGATLHIVECPNSTQVGDVFMGGAFVRRKALETPPAPMPTPEEQAEQAADAERERIRALFAGQPSPTEPPG